MKHWIINSFICFVVIMGVIFGFAPLPIHAATYTLYESYNAGDSDNSSAIYASTWVGQTFTTGPAAHTAPEIRLKLARIGTPSTVTISLRETLAGVPTGYDLASATLDGNSFPLTATWSPFTNTSVPSLKSNTMYAVCVRAIAGTSTSYINWRCIAVGAYTGGTALISTDSGISWSTGAQDNMFEIWGDPVVTVFGANVFKGYLNNETEDWLVVAKVECAYPPYYPYDSAGIFKVQFTNADNSTIFAQVPLQNWGKQPVSIYINADGAAPLVWGSAYKVRLLCTADNTTASYVLTAADWRGTNLAYLDEWVRLCAVDLEDYYGVAYLTEATGIANQVLNTQGAAIFLAGIPGLMSERPDLFSVTVRKPSHTDTTWTHAGETAIDWVARLGPEIPVQLDDFGDIFGLSGQAMGGGLLVIAFLLASLIAGFVGMIICIPLLILGLWVGVVNMSLFMVIGAIALLNFVKMYFWDKGA